MRKILVIEDEPEIRRLVELHLRDLPAEVSTTSDGAGGLAAVRSFGPDLVILDLNLPDVDGLEVCRRLRAAGPYVPILMLTARTTELDRVLGLESGADDYLTKPFSVRELVARARAIFRRIEAMATSEGRELRELRRGALEIHPAHRTVRLEGSSLTLTAKEFDLLLHFARSPGRVYTRAELLDQVWGYSHEGYEHTVNSHINRLRAKVEADPANPRFIETVWGVGYRFREEAE